MSIGKGKKKSSGGRRRNYAPPPDQVGLRGKLPTGWANWLGFFLFGFCGIAVLVASVVYALDGVRADAVVAFGLGLALLYMVYLFGTTRLRV